MFSCNKQQDIYLLGGLLLAAAGICGGWFLHELLQPTIGTVGPTANGLLATLSIIVAYLSSPLVFMAVSLAGAFWAIETHHTRAWIHVTVTIAAVTAFSYLLKTLLEIPRPSGGLITLQTYGFPSAHAAAAGSIVTVGLFHISRFYNQSWIITLPTAVMFISIILASRVLLGVHTVSDVVGGLLIGIGFGLVAIWAWSKISAFTDTSK